MRGMHVLPDRQSTFSILQVPRFQTSQNALQAMHNRLIVLLSFVNSPHQHASGFCAPQERGALTQGMDTLS